MISHKQLSDRLNEIGIGDKNGRFALFLSEAPEVAVAIAHNKYVIVSDNEGRFIVAAPTCGLYDTLLMLSKTA